MFPLRKPRLTNPARPVNLAALARRALTVVGAAILLLAGSSPALGQESDLQDGERPADDKVVELVTDRLATLESMLSKVQSTAAYAPLFKTKDGTLSMMQGWFIRAQKTVHDVNQSIASGEWFDQQAVDDFHNGLGEYLMNLDQLPPNMFFGETKTPDTNTKKKLRKAVGAALEFTGGIPGFAPVSEGDVSAESSSQEAVTYARRSLSQVYVLLDNRTLSGVTSQGRAASEDLRRSLDVVAETLDQLVDTEGNLVVQVDDDDKPLKDQLAPFKRAMREARAQADFFRAYRPVSFPDAQRARAEQIVERLSESGFEKKLSAVKAFKLARDLASQSPCHVTNDRRR